MQRRIPGQADPESPAPVVGSYRDTDVGAGDPLLGLLAKPGTSGLTPTLEGSVDHDVGTLIASAGGDTGDAGVSRIRERTGGNPFFVLHVARRLDAGGLPRPTRPRAAALRVGVRAVLERRLARPCYLGSTPRVRPCAGASNRHFATPHPPPPGAARAGPRRASGPQWGDDLLAALAHHELHAGDERASTPPNAPAARQRQRAHSSRLLKTSTAPSPRAAILTAPSRYGLPPSVRSPRGA